jgi:hypothetical protein
MKARFEAMPNEQPRQLVHLLANQNQNQNQNQAPAMLD